MEQINSALLAYVSYESVKKAILKVII